MRASRSIYSVFVVLLEVLGSDNVHSQQIKDNTYTLISRAHCFRRLNGTHIIGCSFKLSGSVGVLSRTLILWCESILPLLGPNLMPHLFTREYTYCVTKVVFNIPLFFGEEEDTCDVERPEGSWTPWGTRLLELLEDFPFPIYYVADPDDMDKLYDRFELRISDRRFGCPPER
ncbi:AAEL011971-PA [Aedes aegypti]|uniref:AAEL011971-PA n=1 Tax=Aedes aegypti TaxID=7159 RepID=Q16NG3_AEDAE|nr:AAEL011971-PA [Aedes aegypti]